MSEEKTLASTRLYEGRILNLRLDTVELPGGRTTKREIVEHRGAVAIVAVDPQERVVLVRQFRKPVEQTLVELPAGTLSPGEPPLECAGRELQEETGYRAGQIEALGGFFTTPGFSTEYLYIYLATGLVAGEVSPEEDEAIEVLAVPLAEALRLVDAGEIRDAKSVAGLLLYARRQAESRG